MVVFGGLNERGEVLSSLFVLNLESFFWRKEKIRSSADIPALQNVMSTLVIDSDRKFESLKGTNVGCCNFPTSLFDKTVKERTPIEGIYLFGGVDGEGIINERLFVIRVGGTKLKWEEVRTFGQGPAGRVLGSLDYVAASNCLLLHGGCGILENELFNDTFVLDVEGAVWMKVSLNVDFPLYRHSHTSIAVDNYVLIFGGVLENKLAGKEIYRIDLRPFKKNNEEPERNRNKTIKMKNYNGLLRK